MAAMKFCVTYFEIGKIICVLSCSIYILCNIDTIVIEIIEGIITDNTDTIVIEITNGNYVARFLSLHFCCCLFSNSFISFSSGIILQ